MTDYHPRKTHGVALLVMGADAETVAAELEYIAWALRDGKTEWQGRAQGRLITRIAYGQQNEAALHRPHEVGSVARAGSSAKRMGQTAATEVPPHSSAERMNNEEQATTPRNPTTKSHE